MSNSLFTCQSLHIDMEEHSKLTGKNPEINYSTRTLVERWSGEKVMFYKAIFLYWRCGLFHRPWPFIRLLVNQAESETAQTLIAP